VHPEAPSAQSPLQYPPPQPSLSLSGELHVLVLQLVTHEQFPQGASGEPQYLSPVAQMGGQQTLMGPNPNATPFPCPQTSLVLWHSVSLVHVRGTGRQAPQAAPLKSQPGVWGVLTQIGGQQCDESGSLPK
jgi:hypothetical protein